jgi:hypothetical protein
MQVSIRVSKAYADQLRRCNEPMLHMTGVDIVNNGQCLIRVDCHPPGARRSGNRYFLTVRDTSGSLAEAVIDWVEKALDR